MSDALDNDDQELRDLLSHASVRRKKGERSAQARGIERRLRLLQAAARCLDRYPLDEVTYQQIANEAGISPPSCYHFYGNKLELFKALAAFLTRAYNAHAFAPFQKSDVSCWQDIVRLFVERTVEYMAPRAANKQLFLGPHTPLELVAENLEAMQAHGRRLIAALESHFVLPEVPDRERVFFNAIEIARLILSLDQVGNGDISKESAREAARAQIAYLELYLPKVLPRQPDEEAPMTVPDTGPGVR